VCAGASAGSKGGRSCGHANRTRLQHSSRKALYAFTSKRQMVHSPLCVRLPLSNTLQLCEQTTHRTVLGVSTPVSNKGSPNDTVHCCDVSGL